MMSHPRKFLRSPESRSILCVGRESLRFIVAQLGARMHYAVPRMLYEAGMLDYLYTDICAARGWPRLLRVAPRNLMPNGMKRLAERVPIGVPKERIRVFSEFGWKYAQRRRSAHGSGDAMRTRLWAGRAFCDYIIADGIAKAGGVYTFNGAGLELLEYATRHGLRAVTEQTIAPMLMEQRLLKEESEQFPAWAQPNIASSALALFADRERIEWETADIIVCGSQFVKDGIAECGGPQERCAIVPYGVDTQLTVPDRPAREGLLRVLTVGSVGLRKGSPYVLKAAKRLRERATFRMVGRVGAPPAAERELSQHLELVGPVPRSEILKHYAWADVFLLPSICEGSATVTYEAMAAGLPVICTPNTGSVVRDGIEGFIAPIRDLETIIAQLEALATDRALLCEMSRAARIRAENYCTLISYKQRLVAALSTQAHRLAEVGRRASHAVPLS